jgi:hypothetical protein
VPLLRAPALLPLLSLVPLLLLVVVAVVGVLAVEVLVEVEVLVGVVVVVMLLVMVVAVAVKVRTLITPSWRHSVECRCTPPWRQLFPTSSKLFCASCRRRRRCLALCAATRWASPLEPRPCGLHSAPRDTVCCGALCPTCPSCASATTGRVGAVAPLSPLSSSWRLRSDSRGFDRVPLPMAPLRSGVAASVVSS